jgi:hypothetical protein
MGRGLEPPNIEKPNGVSFSISIMGASRSNRRMLLSLTFTSCPPDMLATETIMTTNKIMATNAPRHEAKNAFQKLIAS